MKARFSRKMRCVQVVVCCLCEMISGHSLWTLWNHCTHHYAPLNFESSPAWKEIFDPPPPSWELSRPEAAKELFGVWEVEELWHEKLPLISRRVKVPWEQEREFLVFQPQSFAVIEYSLNKKSWRWTELNTPAYGLDGEGAMRVFFDPINVLRKNPAVYRDSFPIEHWKIKDGLLYYYKKNGVKERTPAEVSEPNTGPSKGLRGEQTRGHPKG